MFSVEFEDQNKKIFREKRFSSPRDMQNFINQFNFIEDKEYTFF